MVSILGILSGATPLMVDVRQTGSVPVLLPHPSSLAPQIMIVLVVGAPSDRHWYFPNVGHRETMSRVGSSGIGDVCG